VDVLLNWGKENIGIVNVEGGSQNWSAAPNLVEKPVRGGKVKDLLERESQSNVEEEGR
jgi:hypothetical protein